VADNKARMDRIVAYATALGAVGTFAAIVVSVVLAAEPSR
jgi:hypothetical protein